MIKQQYYYLLLAILLLSFTGCKKSQIEPDAFAAGSTKDTYVSSELVRTVPLFVLKPLLSANGFGNYSSQATNGISVYKLVYNTTYQGRTIKASGLVCVPTGLKTAAPVVSAQHGTIFADSEAPSGNSAITGFELFAAAGYITFIPDYIGFGESKDIFHPYYDQKHSALAVVDMLSAGKSFFKERDLRANDKLFLVGYSEGGYVTLAAQRELESNPAYGLKVTASAAGAGGYDLTEMLHDVTSGKEYAHPAYLAYLVQAYNHTNNWKRPTTELFKAPYASRLPELFDGSNKAGEINRELPTSPANLFAPTFYEALKDDSREQLLKTAMRNNSLTNWAPQSPTRLYHGTADVVIPYSNSEKTYAALTANGARQLTLIPIPGATHSSTLAPMLEDIFPWLQTF